MPGDLAPIELFVGPDHDPIAVGVKIGQLVHATRIIGIDADTGKLGDGLEKQLTLAYRNLRAVVESAGGTVDNVAQVSFFLKRFDDRAAINDGWVQMFGNEQDRPTYKFMEADLPGEILVQLEMFAVLGARRTVLSIPGVAHTNPIPMGVKIGGYVFSSRILPFDPETGKPPEGFERQADVTFGNLQAFLEAAGAQASDIAQARVFIVDRSLLPSVERRWNELFPDPSKRPVYHTVKYDNTPSLQVYIEIVAAVS